MKKLTIIMILGLIALVSYGQKRPQADKSLKYNETWAVYPGSSSDILDEGDSTWTYTVSKLTTNKVGVEWTVKLDSLSGTADTVDLFFYYSTHGITYALEDTVTWYATSADTTIVFDDDTTRVMDYAELMMRERGDNFKVGVDSILTKYYY